MMLGLYGDDPPGGSETLRISAKCSWLAQAPRCQPVQPPVRPVADEREAHRRDRVRRRARCAVAAPVQHARFPCAPVDAAAHQDGVGLGIARCPAALAAKAIPVIERR